MQKKSLINFWCASLMMNINDFSSADIFFRFTAAVISARWHNNVVYLYLFFIKMKTYNIIVGTSKRENMNMNKLMKIQRYAQFAHFHNIQLQVTALP